MIYKEVLRGIPADDFLRAGERVLASTPSPERLTDGEKKRALQGYQAIAGISNVLARSKDLEPRRSEAADMTTGVIRFSQTLDEYFSGLEAIGELDEPNAQTDRWLKAVSGKLPFIITKRLLSQQRVLMAIEDEIRQSEEDPILLEEESTIREYPAFYQLTEMLSILDCDPERAYDISDGAMLAAVVLRETLEVMTVMEQVAPSLG